MGAHAATPASNVSEAGALPPSAIDAAAVDTVAPADAAVNVRSAFGAKGDGVTDDTAAIQGAISAGDGFGDPDKIL